MQDKPGEMTTLSQVMTKMKAKGYEHEFKMSDHGRMQSIDSKKVFDPEDLKIVKTYRFEGESDPADSTILYLLESKDGEKGYVMDAYGAYSAHEGSGFDDFIKKVSIEDHKEQELL